MSETEAAALQERSRPAARQDSGSEVIAAPVLDRNVARNLAATIACEHRLTFARSFTFAVARAYAESLQPASSIVAPPGHLRLLSLTADAQATASRLGERLAGFAPAEAVYLLGCIYTSVFQPISGPTSGVFTRRPRLSGTRSIWRRTRGTNWRRARRLDPCAGGGAFLIEIIRRIRIAITGTDPALVLSQMGARVRGYDLDPFGAWLAQTAAHFAVHDLEAAGRTAVAGNRQSARQRRQPDARILRHRGQI